MPTREPGLVVPGDLIWAHGRPLLSFVDIPCRALSATFWRETLKQRARTFGLIPLDAYEPRHDDLRLAGAIHHTGRCGSTLMVRQFAAVEGVVALSEPTAFLQLLDAPYGSAQERARWLRLLLAAHRDALCLGSERLVIKWPLHLIFWAKEIAAALPDVPGIFLYRDPIEIIASLEESPLGNPELVTANPFAPALDLRLIGPEARAHPDFVYKMLAARCSAVAAVPGLKSLDYARLPTATWRAVAPWFDITVSTDDVTRMERASAHHSKAMDRIFEPDGPARRARMGEDVRAKCAHIVAPVLAQTLRTLPVL